MEAVSRSKWVLTFRKSLFVLFCFQLSLESCVDVSTPMKEKYVEWTVTTMGIKKARKLYKRCDAVIFVLSSFLTS